MADRPVLPAPDRDAAGRIVAERVVLLDERCGGGGELVGDFIDNALREVEVDPAKGVADSPEEEGQAVAGAFCIGFVGGDCRPGEDGVTEASEPGKGGLLDFRFDEGV